MRYRLSVLAAILAAGCGDPAGPTNPTYSLAGHWFATGSANFDFVATDVPLTPEAKSDSAARGMKIEAVAVGRECGLLRYRTVDPWGRYTDKFGNVVDDGGIILELRCTDIEAGDRFAFLPDRVTTFTVGGITLTRQ